MGSLLVIDDSRVRKQAFTLAQKVIKQIERLERDIESFHNQDQKLFTHWSNVTFRGEREQIARGQSEFEYLCRFHNWMIAISRMNGISLEEALLILREEEETFDAATPLERFAINKARAERDEFLKQESHREQTEMNFEYEDEEEEDDEFRLMHDMSDDELLDLCPTGEDTCDLLARVYNYRRGDHDIRLFLRIWHLLPRETQEYVQEVYESEGRNSFTDFLDALSGRRSGSEQPAEKKPAPHPEESENLKQIYRKLVRQLHPDVTEATPWHRKIWERVQNAHRNQNRFELEKLARLVSIRGKSLNDLRVSEIIESQNWLKQELDGLRREARSHKRSPAWRFSQRKDFKPIIRKMRKTLESELSYIQQSVRELRFELGLREKYARKSQRRQQRHR